LHLTGLVSESGYQGQAHWLMFLFEVKPRFVAPPQAMEEGRFAFHDRADLEQLPLPVTDRDWIWPMFWQHRGGFFASHCRCESDGTYMWSLEQSNPLTLPHE
jgi:8-oxo-dGTP diphosphatase